MGQGRPGELGREDALDARELQLEQSRALLLPGSVCFDYSIGCPPFIWKKLMSECTS